MKAFSAFLFFASFILTASLLFGLYAIPPEPRSDSSIIITDGTKSALLQ
jgi:hypothetical protein